MRKCPDHPALLELDALLNPGTDSGSGRQTSAATALTATRSRRRVFPRLDARAEQATQMVVGMGLPEALVRQVQALRYEGCNMYYTDPNNLYENVAARQQQDQPAVAAPPPLPTAALPPPPPRAREVAAPGELAWRPAGGLSEEQRLRCAAHARRHTCRWLHRSAELTCSGPQDGHRRVSANPRRGPRLQLNQLSDQPVVKIAAALSAAQ